MAGGDFAYFENRETLQQLRFKREAEHSETSKNLHIMDECVANMPISVGLEKNSPLKGQLDKYIARAVEAGLIRKWMMTATKSFESSVEPQPAEAFMDLKKFYGALVALGCGYGLGILAFLIEVAYWKLFVERHKDFDKYYGKIITTQSK